MKKELTSTHLREYMKAHGLSQTQLSTLIGTSKFTVNRWLRGHWKISSAYQEVIKKRLKIVVDTTQPI
jgi:DNA-binding transcriptional regulator YiaG